MDTKKVNLYQGQPIPLDALDADSFEDFAHQILIKIGKSQEFEITSGPLNSSDQGFDLTGKRSSDQSTICFQCKRYNSKSIGLPILGDELAKVALNSHFESSLVKEHYLLTTGSLTKELNSQLRSTSRDQIIKLSTDSLAKGSFKSLVKQCSDKDPVAVVTEYILSLDKIIVWSGRDIDNNIGSIWSEVEDIIDNFFKLERVLTEQPRPNFKISKYIQDLDINDYETLELTVFPSPLPSNIRISEHSNHKCSSQLVSNNMQTSASIDSLPSMIEFGNAMLLTGKGGAGKTTSLTHLQSSAVSRITSGEEEELPIYIKLSAYRGNLDKLIHDHLGITYGCWQSLPYNFILLFDGLDEISIESINIFSEQVEHILRRYNVKAIISLRESGVRVPMKLATISHCFSLSKLNFQQIIQYSESILKDNAKCFVDELHSKANSLGAETFSLPFGLMVAIDYFKIRNSLPERLHEVIYELLGRRVKRNQERLSPVGQNINLISETTIFALADAIAFEIRIIQKKAALYQEEAEAVVTSALQRIKKDGVFGANELTETIAFSISLHYEMLRKTSNGTYITSHDIISDCLAGKTLAKHWREHINDAGGRIGWDAWTFAAFYLPQEDQESFINTMLSKDLVLAARCSKEVNLSGVEAIEHEIFKASQNSSLIVFSNAMYSACILKTDNCINLLRDSLKEKDSHKNYNAQRCLARSGDHNFLNHILADNERMKAAGLNPSGGTFNMWFEAPVKVTIEIARERINQYLAGKISYIPIALETLERYGDTTDIDRLVKVLNKTENLSEFYICSRCLFNLDRSLAIGLLQSKTEDLENSDCWLYAMNVLNYYDYPIDVSNLFKKFLAIRAPSAKEHISSLEHITKILCKNKLPETAAVDLLELLESLNVDDENDSNLYQFYNIWEIATYHKLIQFKDKAIKQLEESNLPKLTVSINYGKGALIGSADEQDFLSKCILQLEELINNKEPSFHLLNTLLDALKNLSDISGVIGYVNQLLHIHLPLYHQIVNAAPEQKDDTYQKYNHGIQYILPNLTDIKEELDSENLINIIGMNVCHNTEEIRSAYKDIISILPRRELEKHIDLIFDPFVKVHNLGCLASMEKTNSTELLFIKYIPMLLTHHLFYTTLIALAKKYWNTEIEAVLIKCVSEFQWTQEEILFREFQRVINDLSILFNLDSLDRLLIPAAKDAHDQRTKYLLNLWIDFIKHCHEQS